MQIKKFVATGLSALMAGATLAGGALAATQLGALPGALGTDGQLDAFVVVGADAAPSDVVGAIDVAANLASLSYTEVATGTTTTTTGGLEKDGITIGLTANPTTGNLGTGSNGFPTTSALKNSHYSGLASTSFTFNSTTIKTHEEVDLSQGTGVKMRHDLATDKINGTLKMVVGTNGNVIARYVFDNQIENVGTITSSQYSKELKISFLGKSFSIVGVGTNSIKMLAGTVGTATKDGDARNGVTSGKYTVYVTAAANNDWSTLSVEDDTGKVVDTITNAKEGDTKTATKSGLDVKVTDIRVTGTDPVTQHIEADIVVGPTGQAEVEYDGTADTGSNSKERFPGTTDWYITYRPTSSGVAGTAGTISNGASVNAEYRPGDTKYLVAGEGINLPGDYGTLKFQGFNTDSFSTVTIRPVGPITGYNSTDNSLPGSTMYGLEISADGTSVGAGALGTPNWYSSMYLLFNQTVTATGGTYLPTLIGYKNTKGNIQINDTLTTNAITAVVTGANAAPLSRIASGASQAVWPTTELGWALVNVTAPGLGDANGNQTVTFPFKLNYNGVGDSTFWLNLTVNGTATGNAGQPKINATIASTSLGGTTTQASGTSGSLRFAFNNKTTWVADASNLASDLLRLGDTASSAEDKEINSTTEAGVNNAGRLTQDSVDDAGIILVASQSNGGSDKVVVKVPSKILASKVFFGGTGAATTTTGGTVKQVAPVTNAIAKLDTEVGGAEKAKNLVLVGGPAVNRLTADAMGLPYPSYGAASTIAEGTAIIRIVDDAFTTGKIAVIVAGFEADDTRLATSVLQQAATKLAGVTASSVVVSGTEVATATITPE